jgi:hypothetical protein
MILLRTGQVAGAVSPEAERCQNPVDANERCKIGPRLPEGHSGAGHRVKHPSWDEPNISRMDLDEDELPIGPSQAVEAPQASAIERMPAIVDRGFLRDMGRMNGN